MSSRYPRSTIAATIAAKSASPNPSGNAPLCRERSWTSPALRPPVNSATIDSIHGSIFRPLELVDATRRAFEDAGLTKRELSILQELPAGGSNQEIAKRLFLAEQTVKFHLTNIYRKLGVSTRTEALRHAYEHGLVERPLSYVA